MNEFNNQNHNFEPNNNSSQGHPEENSTHVPPPQPESPQTPPQPNTYTYRAPERNQQNGYGFAPQHNPSPNQSNKGMKVFVGILSGVVAICLILAFGISLGKNFNQSESGEQLGTAPTSTEVQTEKGQEYTTGNSAVYSSDVNEVAKKVSPSVVGITVYSDTSSSSAQASGIIMNKEGYILTNDHIYSEIADPKFVITMNDGTSYKAVYYAGDTRSDLAVLLMSEKPDNLKPATFGNSDNVQVGNDVIAIGSPFGLSDTVTKGIVSAPSRRISNSNSGSSSNEETSNYTMKVIQTDTAINPGNSGGALVNMNGEVIGINSSKIAMTGYEGIGFAIPSNNAKTIFTELTKYKKVVNRGRIGVTYTEITSSTALVNNVRKGLMIQSISNNSSLYNVGVSQGDIIVGVNGKEIETADDLLDIVESNPAGTKIKLTIYMNATGKEKDYTISLLEDDSGSSYIAQEQKTTQPVFDLGFGF
jgi:S1-C subfamily serine protease